MSEKITPLSTPEAYESEFSDKFAARLDQASLEIPEIAETREIIERGGKALSQEFGLKPELLDDEAHSLFILALSQRYGKLLVDQESGQNSEDFESERDFIYDATALVALEKSALYDGYQELISTETELDPEQERLIFDKYTNREATDEIKKAISDGLLGDIKARMKITDENETPYDVRVLNVGDVMSLCGMRPSSPDNLFDLPLDDPEYLKWQSQTDEYHRYADPLEENAEKFMSEAGLTGEIPLAWKTTIDGVNTLVLHLPVVDKMLHRDEKTNSEYNDSDLLRERAIIEHEYVHTQHPLFLDEDSLVGISIEERRAELFSGDKQGYRDIKEEMILMGIISGVKICDEIREQGVNCSMESFFKFLANSIGVQRALEFSLIPPRAYVLDSTKPLLSSINEHLGGMNEFLKNLFKDAVNNGRGQIIDENFTNYAKIICGIKDSDKGSFYLHQMKNTNNLPFGAAKIQEKIDLLYPSEKPSGKE